MILQGEIYLIDPGEPFGSEPGFYRPWVVVQNDAMNRSGLNTVVVLPLTTNLQRVSGRGNVLVPAGAAGLRADSVVQVHQPSTA